jgi:hypothetical protein
MTDRTFQQWAQGYGSTPCQVVCQIDGNTVFSGTVTTLDVPLPSLPDAEYMGPPVAWSWQDSADFSGTKQFTVSVTGSTLLLAQTFANNPYGNVANLEEFGSFYSREIDGIIYHDPFTNETIDGVVQQGPYEPTESGQWWWTIPAGSTFAATMNVIAATPPTPPEPTP